MNSNVLKLIEKDPALSIGGYLSLDEAAASIGVERNRILRMATDHRLKLYCRLAGVPGHIVSIESLELDPSVSGGLGRIVPTRSQLPESSFEQTYNGVLSIPDSKQVASSIIAENLEHIDLVLFNLPEAAGKVFLPDSTILVAVGSIEVQAKAIDIIRVHLAREVTPEQIRRASALTDVARSLDGPGAGKLFSEAVEAYCTESEGLQKTLESSAEQRQRKAGILLFMEFMGDMRLKEIDADMLRAFRDGPLRSLPANSNRLPKDLRRSTMKEMVEVLKADGRTWPLMSLDMQGERMQWLSRFFKWVHEKKQWTSLNPAAPLSGETGRSKAEMKEIKRERRSRADEDEEGVRLFSQDELTRIFGQQHYKIGDGRHVTKPSYWYPFQYWIPLLGLYAGCRIKEASQLHLDDIRLEADVWCIDVNENTADKSIKNEQSKRLIPLHPKLIELGFLDYCERLRNVGYRRVFPDLTWAKTDAKYAKESIRKMSAMLLSLGMPRDNTNVFHNFRHNVNGMLSRVPMASLPFADENLKFVVRHLILGHLPGESVNMKHYTHITMLEMYALIAGIHYDLPPIAKLDIDFAIKCVQVALGKKKDDRQGREDMGPLNLEIYGT
ncbi:site-specific integrase [Janthinobacterium sp. 61]|uniref:site-specific integrase n=1 Tax=Janthinobacterium sp. 61 TaxID=2035209 RepID=UPI0015D5EF0E|nr:site-specific integrase [Janthinobacterium sp. 61]